MTIGDYKFELCCKVKVGQGQPLTKGYNNASTTCNCYSFTAFGRESLLKSIWGVTAPHLSQLMKL